MAVVKTKKSTNTAIYVSEFKAWLSGVEDMQESGWCPNAEQWKKIRSKITLLQDEVNEVVVQQQYPNNGNIPLGNYPAHTIPINGIPAVPYGQQTSLADFVIPPQHPTAVELNNNVGTLTEDGNYASPYL